MSTNSNPYISVAEGPSVDPNSTETSASTSADAYPVDTTVQVNSLNGAGEGESESEMVSNFLSEHESRQRRSDFRWRLYYLFMAIATIVCFVVPFQLSDTYCDNTGHWVWDEGSGKSKLEYDNGSNCGAWLGLIIGGSFAACLLVLPPLFRGCFSRDTILKEMRANPSGCVFWRLEGDHWRAYVESRMGPKAGCGFCCRRGKYRRLLSKPSGHIGISKKGLIIDEMNFINFRSRPLESVSVVRLPLPSTQLVLRVQVAVQTRYERKIINYDLWAPPHVTEEQLQALANRFQIGLTDAMGDLLSVFLALGRIRVAPVPFIIH